MRKKIKIFLFSVMAILLLCSSAFLRSPPISARADESNSLYTEKIVAVVYDNSGSMLNAQRSPNAKYALQALMSIFDSDDTMCVFPLNPNNDSTGISVNLSSDDRNGVIKEIIENDRFTPVRGADTPPEAIGYAIDWLAEMKMNEEKPVLGKEYWLVILSDGAFTGDKKTSEIIREEISGYIGLQTIYFAISPEENEKMKIDDLVEENSAVTAYYTEGTDDIISKMRELSNQVTGRYTLPSGVNVNGNQVVIDLSKNAISLSSIAVLAEAVDTNKSIELKDIDCSTISLKNHRACSISIHEDLVDISGYSSVILPTLADKYLSKDIITLTFSTDIKDIRVLVEPTIIIDSDLQYLNAQSNEWKDISLDEINTSFKKGERIKPIFKLLDAKTGNDLTNVLSDVVVSVSYNGKSYAYNEAFSLENGKKEVSLSVTINIGGSKYVLYDSWVCDIDENPSSFRVESKVTENFQGHKEKVKVDYTIYYNDQKVSKTGFDEKYFTYEFVEVIDPQGKLISYDEIFVNSDGSISLIYTVNPNLYGNYTCKIKVTCQENKKYRFGESEIEVSISQLSVSAKNSDMTLTTNQIIDNMSAMEFTLTANGQPISFSNPKIRYELKIGGINVTEKTNINGNVLSYVPNSENLPTSLLGLGDRAIELNAWVNGNESVSSSLISKLSIIKPTYIIEVFEENNKVDIYDLENCKAKIRYRVSLDGEYFTAEELQNGLDTGTIVLRYNKFGWDLLLPPEVTTKVLEINGQAYIECSLGTTWWKPISSLASSFIFTGEKAVTLEIAGRSGVGEFSLTPVTILSRIWRWALIILIIYTIVHIVLWIIGFFITKPLPRGFVVKITMGSLKGSKITLKASKVNFETKLKVIWHLKRFIPFKEFMNQPSMKVSKVELLINENKEERMFTIGDIHEYSLLNSPEDEAYEELITFIGKCRTYNPRKNRGNPKLSNPITTKACEDIFDDKEKLIPSKQKISISGYYARKNEKEKVTEILFFVRAM